MNHLDPIKRIKAPDSVLDDKGQHTVDTVTQMEYERVKGGGTAILKK